MLRASSPHIRPLVGEVRSNFKNRLRILENGSHGNERNILPPLVTRGFPYRPLPGSWGMLVEITVSGMIFQENRDNKNERFTVRDVFGLGPVSIRLHAGEQIETIYIRTFMRGIRREVWWILKWSWLIYFYWDEVSWFG